MSNDNFDTINKLCPIDSHTKALDSSFLTLLSKVEKWSCHSFVILTSPTASPTLVASGILLSLIPLIPFQNDVVSLHYSDRARASALFISSSLRHCLRAYLNCNRVVRMSISVLSPRGFPECFHNR